MLIENIDNIINNQVLPGTTQISRLYSIKNIIDTTTQLILLCTSFETQYQLTMNQPLSLIYPENLKNIVVEVIKICTSMSQSFAKTIQITSISDNLMAFLVSIRQNIMIICYLKSAVYEQAFQNSEQGILAKCQVDKILKIDQFDTVIMAQFMKQILQHNNSKLGDDVKTFYYIKQVEQFYKHIFKSQLYCVKRLRFERLLYYLQQNMTKIISTSKSMISDKFKLYKITSEKPRDNLLLNSEFIVLG